MTTYPTPGSAAANYLAPTIGSNVDASLRSHGRTDFNRGVPFNLHAAKAWQEGWTSEAHLAAIGARTPALATIMSGVDLAATLEAMDLVLRQAITARPTKHQQVIVASARRHLDDSLNRLRAALDADGASEHAATNEARERTQGSVRFPD
jgi:hypothetical protein